MAFICRRRFLERMGLGGAAAFFLTPLVRRLIGEAQGAVPQQRRVIFFNLGHGIDESIRRPKAVRSQADFDLSDALAPLEPYKNRVHIYDGLYNSNSGDLHGAINTYYSCVPGRGTSIDQVIAGGIPAAPRGERSVHLGINREPVIVEGRIGSGAGVFSRGGSGIVPHDNPIESVKQLFGQAPAAGMAGPSTPVGNGGGGGADRRLSLLSFAGADIRKARMRLAGAEREKLDLYLSAVEQMEMRTKIIKTMPLPAAAAPGKCGVPAVGHIKASTMSMKYPWDTATGALNPSHVLRDAYTDIALNTLACGITNVVTIEMYDGGNSIYLLDLFEGEAPELTAGPRVNLSHMHDMYHGAFKPETYRNSLAEPQKSALVGRVRQRFQNLAIVGMRRLLDGLSALPEGNGTMLDNTVVVWGSDCGGAHHGGQNDLPVLMVGNVGGQLTGPRYFRYAKKAKPQTELWLSLANLMDARDASGAPIKTFGQGGKDPCTGPLPLE